MKKGWMKFLVLAMALFLVGGMVVTATAATANGNAQNGAGLGQCIMAGQQRAQTALKAVAALTGLSVDDIRSQRADGKSLAAIAETKGVSEQAVIDQVVAERTAALEQLKANDKITEAQYQNCVDNMQERIKANVERTNVGPDNGNQAGQGMGRQCNKQGQSMGQGMNRGNGNQANCPFNTDK